MSCFSRFVTLIHQRLYCSLRDCGVSFLLKRIMLGIVFFLLHEQPGNEKKKNFLCFISDIWSEQHESWWLFLWQLFVRMQVHERSLIKRKFKRKRRFCGSCLSLFATRICRSVCLGVSLSANHSFFLLVIHLLQNSLCRWSFKRLLHLRGQWLWERLRGVHVTEWSTLRMTHHSAMSTVLLSQSYYFVHTVSCTFMSTRSNGDSRVKKTNMTCIQDIKRKHETNSRREMREEDWLGYVLTTLSRTFARKMTTIEETDIPLWPHHVFAIILCKSLLLHIILSCILLHTRQERLSQSGLSSSPLDQIYAIQTKLHSKEWQEEIFRVSWCSCSTCPTNIHVSARMTTLHQWNCNFSRKDTAKGNHQRQIPETLTMTVQETTEEDMRVIVVWLSPSSSPLSFVLSSYSLITLGLQ